MASVVLFFGSLAVGLFVLDDQPPVYLMYVWDGVVVAFLFMWLVGLLTNATLRALSLEKFLHLPVSLTIRVPYQLSQLASEFYPADVCSGHAGIVARLTY